MHPAAAERSHENLPQWCWACAGCHGTLSIAVSMECVARHVHDDHSWTQRNWHASGQVCRGHCDGIRACTCAFALSLEVLLSCACLARLPPPVYLTGEIRPKCGDKSGSGSCSPFCKASIGSTRRPRLNQAIGKYWLWLRCSCELAASRSLRRLCLCVPIQRVLHSSGVLGFS